MNLSLVDGTVGYGNEPVLSGANVSIGSGEIVCLLGPNGVGKSTLFRSMMRLQPLLAGSLILDGENAEHISRARFARSVGHVPQSHDVPFSFDVIDVVLMGRTARLSSFGAPATKDYRLAEQALERLGIAHLAKRSYAQLSGGQRQMVLIARAIAQETDLILMDEPSSSLDYANQARLLEIALTLVSQGIGVFMTTHNPDHAFLCHAHTILAMPDGTLAQGSADTLLTEENLTKVYGLPIALANAHTPDGALVKSCVPLIDTTARAISPSGPDSAC